MKFVFLIAPSVWVAQAREELIESVCHKEVGVYQQIFSTTGETAQVLHSLTSHDWNLHAGLTLHPDSTPRMYSIIRRARSPDPMCVPYALIVRG